MNKLEKFQKLGSSMSVKIHFLHSHVDFPPENVELVSKGQGERYPSRYQRYGAQISRKNGQKHASRILLNVKRGSSEIKCRRTSKRSFKGKRESLVSETVVLHVRDPVA
ncbi:hypothetical protein TNCV_766601 [Trichonephila clavipes]|nr:hypothetical protein TNCV_766601 [Trichonephila clavipes]